MSRKIFILSWLIWLIFVGGIVIGEICLMRICGMDTVPSQLTLALCVIVCILFVKITALGYPIVMPLLLETKRSWQAAMLLLGLFGLIAVAASEQMQAVAVGVRLLVAVLLLVYVYLYVDLAYRCTEM